jgi:hypothetical protein
MVMYYPNQSTAVWSTGIRQMKKSFALSESRQGRTILALTLPWMVCTFVLGRIEGSSTYTTWKTVGWYPNCRTDDPQKPCDAAYSPMIAGKNDSQCPFYFINHLLTPSHSIVYRASQLLCGGEEGLIWRYEYIDDATLELLSQWKA